jgi:uncharacterized protein (TIGR02466 family)
MIDEIFPCCIFSKDLDLDNKSLEKYALFLKKENQGGVTKSNQGGYHTFDLPFLEEEVLTPLYNELIKCLDDYKNHLHFKQNLKSQIENMWIIINDENNYNLSHTHPGSVFSGVYYINAPENSGDIVFENPSASYMQYDWNDTYKENYNRLNAETFFYKAVTGKLILFPSWLTHRVTSNLSNKKRIALSFNSKFYNE